MAAQWVVVPLVPDHSRSVAPQSIYKDTVDTRPRKPHIERVDDQEFHWLTGILEGEATFAAGSPSSPNSPLVRVVMTDRDVVERVAGYVRRAVVPLEPRKEDYKIPYAVAVRGIAAVRLMVQAKRELGRARQEQIDRALDGWGADRAQWSYDGLRCNATGCDAQASVHGLCRGHFNRWYKATRRGRPTDITLRSLTAADVLRPPESHARTVTCNDAWLAGLLEGEGTFDVTYSDWRGYPRISVNMCSNDVIERAAQILGAAGIHPRAPGDPKWSPTYVTSITGTQAAHWMQRLRPMMGERRRAAIDAALDAYYPERLPVAPEHWRGLRLHGPAPRTWPLPQALHELAT
jgi:hypothetical protein